MKTVPHLFADMTAKLEDLHGISVEGQRRDNPQDLQRVFACSMRMGIVALDASVREIKQRLGDAHD